MHLKREKLQPNKIHQHKILSSSRKLNTERSKFKTIFEIPADHGQEVSHEEKLETCIKPLTKENLKENSESEEEEILGERILNWLETAATGKEALQQVHHTLGGSPEFAEANAIVVVYNENLKA